METPQIKPDTIWSYRGKEYRVLSIRNEHLIEDTNGHWVPTVRYTTRVWGHYQFYKPVSDFIKEFEFIPNPRTKPVKLNKNEQVVLQAMISATPSSWESDAWPYWFFGFETIRRYSGGSDRNLIRRIVRSLARKGMAEYRRGLSSEDGEVAGAGYGVTIAGRDFIHAIDPATIPTTLT